MSGKRDRKHQARILLVEDDNSFRQVLAKQLTKFGFQVQTAKSGEEALKHLQDGSFALVVSDIDMPDGTGVQLLENINTHKINVPVILMTGGLAITEEEVLRLGAKCFLQKPFQSKELRLRIEVCLPFENVEGEE